VAAPLKRPIMSYKELKISALRTAGNISLRENVGRTNKEENNK